MPNPPRAQKIPKSSTLHGDARVDDYFWLRDRNSPEVTSYLEAENDYTQEMMKDTEELQQTLYEEMVARTKEDDASVPARKADYFYYTRREKGQNYAIHCRKQGSLDAEEEIILDENELAQEHDYFRVGIFSVSPDHNTLAYSVDTNGGESYALRFKDLSDGRDLAEIIEDTYYSFSWGNDNRTVFYTRIDAAHRPDRLFRHELGTDPSDDVLVFQEKDDAFFMWVHKTRSGRYILMGLESNVTSEFRYLDADNPSGEFRMVEPRKQDVEYDVEHQGDRFYIRTNQDAVNFKLMSAPVTDPSAQNWGEVIPYDDDVMITGIDAFADFLAISQRIGGLPVVTIRSMSGDERKIEVQEPVYDIGLGDNREFESDTLRYEYSSGVTPHSVFDYDVNNRTRELKKETEILGYDRTNFETSRIHATAPDGTNVPISLVFRKGALDHGPAHVLLMGYGSYGISMDVGFRSNQVSLLERGVVIATAHVRGGGEMGRRWHDNGKYMHKTNTFTDFIACAERLIDAGYTTPEHLAATGGSAGGLLMGAVTNMRPDLFRAVIAHVPFVDVLTTMLDETLPLTVGEWEEWGNPNQEDYYHYMKSYSPYDNVEAKAYPDMLITAGLNDPRVSYWEPAKWSAKLRDMKTGDNVLLLKTNMGAGHGGVSGRYEQFKEVAFEYAFILKRLGLTR
ncbi:MAG: S9 family peptidase [Dehalococcoidia bacterium]